MRQVFGFEIGCEMEQKEIESRIDAVCRAVCDFALANADHMIWTSTAGDCIYVRSILGDFERGDRVPCSRIAEIVREWLCQLSGQMVDVPDAFSTEGECAAAKCAVSMEIRCPNEMRGLVLSCLNPSGEAIEQLAFTRACGINEELADE